jgi:hypothetical protein
MVITATAQLTSGTKNLAAREKSGKSLQRFCDSYDKDGTFKGIELGKSNSDGVQFARLKA